MTDRCFFGTLATLAGSGQQENQFSRTFVACFDQSEFFQQQILEELFALCRIRSRKYTDVHWDCAVEVPTPLAGGGRIDIRLAPTGDVGAKLPVFHLESKLGSPLTLDQLRRYRKKGVEYLIAVTKRCDRIRLTVSRVARSLPAESALTACSARTPPNSNPVVSNLSAARLCVSVRRRALW